MSEVQKGDRVRLVRTSDEYTRLHPGDLGTVTAVRVGRLSGVTVDVDWDSGSNLSLLAAAGDEWARV